MTDVMVKKAGELSIAAMACEVSRFELPSLENLEYAIKRLRKDAAICSKIQSKQFYPPEALTQVADFLESWRVDYDRKFQQLKTEERNRIRREERALLMKAEEEDELEELGT